MKDMNRNRHNIPRDETTRMVHSQCQAATYSWLRTLRAIRGLPVISPDEHAAPTAPPAEKPPMDHRADIDTATEETGNV